MKVKLDSKGKLEITAETELESYALSKWYEDWYAKKATLSVHTVEIINEDNKS